MADRPDRVPAEEVRRRMLDAGRELALEVGAALTILWTVLAWFGHSAEAHRQDPLS